MSRTRKNTNIIVVYSVNNKLYCLLISFEYNKHYQYYQISLKNIYLLPNLFSIDFFEN